MNQNPSLRNLPILCDCGHALREHTDRGPNTDAWLCLATVSDPTDTYTGIPCDCDEFVESERDD